MLGKKVASTSDCIGAEAEKAAANLQDGEVLLLENLAFMPRKKQMHRTSPKALARLADVYVDDAFGTAHRKHASIVGITKYLPSVSGLLLDKELEYLGGLLSQPQHPFCALLGGAKISDKVGLLQNIMGKVDRVLIGGGMAATFLKAKGFETGQSLVENDSIDTVKQIIAESEKRHIKLTLPIDVVVANNLTTNAVIRTVSVDKILSDMKIADIGPKTVTLFREQLEDCRTVFWNGPMGVYEVTQFAAGTKAMAETLAGLKASTVIGGGSTADVVVELKLEKKMTFVSTGGGASLALLSGEILPGVEALMDKGKV